MSDGEDLRALGALLLSESPRVVSWGEDRSHMPTPSMDAVTKNKWARYME